METITAILEGFDLAKIVPDLGPFLGNLRLITILAALVGPVVMLLAGIWYLKSPPAEANHKAGFRTYFGMGSVQAWQFTQKLAGKAWGALGAVLTVVTVIVCLIFGGKDAMQAVGAAAVMLIIQALAALLCYLAVTVTVTVTFDKDGNRRK